MEDGTQKQIEGLKGLNITVVGVIEINGAEVVVVQCDRCKGPRIADYGCDSCRRRDLEQEVVRLKAAIRSIYAAADAVQASI